MHGRGDAPLQAPWVYADTKSMGIEPWMLKTILAIVGLASLDAMLFWIGVRRERQQASGASTNREETPVIGSALMTYAESALRDAAASRSVESARAAYLESFSEGGRPTPTQPSPSSAGYRDPEEADPSESRLRRPRKSPLFH